MNKIWLNFFKELFWLVQITRTVNVMINIICFFYFSIQTLEGNHDATSKDLIEAKTDFRKTERHWMAEKEFLMRKVQFLQHYGSVVPPSIDGGGYFTENRSNVRKGGDLKAHRDLQKVNVSIFAFFVIFFLKFLKGLLADKQGPGEEVSQMSMILDNREIGYLTDSK